MAQELFSIAERIKNLREKENMTQVQLAKILGLSRSGVNAWEMGLSVPSTQYIVELAKTFNISADYLLGLEDTSCVSTKGLTDQQITAIHELIKCFQDANS